MVAVKRGGLQRCGVEIVNRSGSPVLYEWREILVHVDIVLGIHIEIIR
jgi:hypothetical protein